MKNNHPIVKAHLDARSEFVPTRAKNAESTNLQSSCALCEYEPKVVNTRQPQWIENADKIPFLDAMFKRDFYNSENSYNVNNEGTIEAPHYSRSNGILRAAPYVIDIENGDSRYAFTNIVNTENAGLRYVHFTESGNMLDMGPVDHLCFIGNEQRAEGLYIPLSNTKAVADGIMVLDEFIARAIDSADELPSD